MEGLLNGAKTILPEVLRLPDVSFLCRFFPDNVTGGTTRLISPGTNAREKHLSV